MAKKEEFVEIRGKSEKVGRFGAGEGKNLEKT
jgi:hypothetical protein